MVSYQIKGTGNFSGIVIIWNFVFKFVLVSDEYGELMDWHQLHPQKGSKFEYPINVTEDSADETEGVQSKQRWDYVKVNMDGVIVGRKICIGDHSDYSSLAITLEGMFGKCKLKKFN